MGKVLVVDDEIDICILLGRQLEKMGLDVSYCLTIKEAIEKLSRETYSLIFIDLNITDGSGYDLISSLSGINSEALIIVISAYDSERDKAMQAGASWFVAKPFSKRSIKEALQKVKFLNNLQ
jgi:DNA-binding response OmpR family regulator